MVLARYLDACVDRFLASKFLLTLIGLNIYKDSENATFSWPRPGSHPQIELTSLKLSTAQLRLR
jgi:hypothetical protein